MSAPAVEKTHIFVKAGAGSVIRVATAVVGSSMEMKNVNLGEGYEIEVLADDYPWITEWDWVYDEETAQAMRLDEEGNKVFLFNEIVQHHTETGGVFPSLQEEAIEAWAGKYVEFGKASEALDYFGLLAVEQGISFPDVYDMVAHTLTVVLVSYFSWKRRGTSLTYEEHKDPMTILKDGEGRFLKSTKVPEYKTLGEWLDTEYGDEDKDQTYGVLLAFFLPHTWIEYVMATNSSVPTDKVNDFWMALNKEDPSLGEVIYWIYLIVQTYPLP